MLAINLAILALQFKWTIAWPLSSVYRFSLPASLSIFVFTIILIRYFLYLLCAYTIISFSFNRSNVKCLLSSLWICQYISFNVYVSTSISFNIFFSTYISFNVFVSTSVLMSLSMSLSYNVCIFPGAVYLSFSWNDPCSKSSKCVL